jgi:hypothetical protein
MRQAAWWLGIGGALALAGCGQSDTAVHVRAHLGTLAYDELQFGLTVAGGQVVVDPMTNGLYQGPFPPGDQDVLIYLRDDLAGSQLHCEATALRAGTAVATGASDVTVVRDEMKDVEIFMADPGSGGGGGSTGTSGDTGCGPGGKMVIPTGACNGAGMCDSPAKIKCQEDTTCVAGVCTEVQTGQP